MDYRVDFSAAQEGGIDGLLRRLAARSAHIENRDGAFTLSNNIVLRPTEDGAPALDLKGVSDSNMFDLLQTYFQEVAGSDHGALVTLSDDGVATMIALSNEDDVQTGKMPLGFVVPADEILANREVFLSAWPGLIKSDNSAEDLDDQEGPIITTQHPERGMIFSEILPAAEDETDLVSFMIFGMSAQAVMENVVAAHAYVQEDPEFLRLDLPNIEGVLEAVSFDTSKGQGIELRLPLAQTRIEDAINLLAQQVRAGGVYIYYVTDIIDEEEIFIIQLIEPDGVLAAPERIKLQ